MENKYLVATGSLLESKSESECNKIAEQCATVLSLIAHGRGQRRAQVVLGIQSVDGVSKGNWVVTIERMDNVHGLH